MRTQCIITVDGTDVTSAVLPRLIDLTVSDKAGASSDTCQIRLDDTDGRLLLPRQGVRIEVKLGSGNTVQKVFAGVVDEVRSSGSRSDGQILSISAKGVDTLSKAKERQERHWDDADLQTVITDAGEPAGISDVRIDPELGAIRRQYWAMQNVSFLSFAERMAEEVGATFKVSGSTAIMVARNGGTAASGVTLPEVTARAGENLIAWDIAPALGRPRFKKVKVRHYDKKTATTKTETVEIEGDDEAEAALVAHRMAADQDQALQIARSAKIEAERARGGGSVTINGSTAPQPEAALILSGARPGIDGTYRIETVTHSFSQSSGWTTQVEVKQPHGDAGKDTRSSKQVAPASAASRLGFADPAQRA